MDLNGFMDIDEDLPLELLENARCALLETLPETSKQYYEKVYKAFKEWQESYGVKSVSPQLILAYFKQLAEKYKPSSLWAFHSMLKATLRAHENVDIGQFSQVKAFLKTKASGYKGKKAKIFTEGEIQRFFKEADDAKWLDVKVACIFGICGACRTDELLHAKQSDVTLHDDMFLVELPQTKTKVLRSFTISGEFSAIVQRYISLRPANAPARFFLNYQRAKCTIQPIGKNKFGKMPRRIAEFLMLPTPLLYTGHSFRRTSATILANSGADMETIMRHGAWRNESCARGYVEISVPLKERTETMISSLIFGNRPSEIVGITSPSTATTSPAPIIAIPAPIVANRAPIVANRAPIVANRAPIVANRAPIVANRAPIVANRAPIVANRAPIVANRAPIVANRASIVANRAPIVANRAPIVASREIIVGDTSPSTGSTISTLTVEANSSSSTDATDFSANLFDADIGDEDLVRVVDHASQQYQQSDADEFDCEIADDDFVRVVEHASQQYQRSEADDFHCEIADDELVRVVEHESQQYSTSAVDSVSELNNEHELRTLGRVRPNGQRTSKEIAGSATALTEHNNHAALLDALLPASFKPINFEKVEHCHFHIHLPK